MFVNRMMNDPEFAERVRAQQAEASAAADFGGCPLGPKPTEVDPAEADAYLARDKENAPAPPVSEEEDAAWKRVAGREGEVRVVAQGLAFLGAHSWEGACKWGATIGGGAWVW